jgi:hypothetical protein
MTYKEKAKALVDKCYQLFPLQGEVKTKSDNGELEWHYDNWAQARQCALIAVEEIIAYEKRNKSYQMTGGIGSPEYWQMVKHEIQKL